MHQALFDLLVPSASAGGARELPSPGTPGADAALQIASSEKCLWNLLEHWRRAGALPPELEAARQAMALRARHAAALSRALPEGTILLKGEALGRYYPPDVPRYSADVDVLVPNVNALGPLHAMLYGAGYRHDGAGYWHLRPINPVVQGFASFRYEHSEPGDSHASVEVQVGGFPIGWNRVLPWSEFAMHCERTKDLACQVLSPTWQLTLAMVDAFGRVGPVTLRHLADMVLLLRARGGEIEIDQVARSLLQHDAVSGLDRFLNDLSVRGMQSLVPAALIELQRATVGLAKRTGVGRRRSHDPLHKWMGRLDRWADRPMLARLACFPPAVRFMLRRGRRVCGVPVSKKTAEVAVLEEIAGLLVLRSGAGTFVLSLLRVGEGERRRLFDTLKRNQSI